MMGSDDRAKDYDTRRRDLVIRLQEYPDIRDLFLKAESGDAAAGATLREICDKATAPLPMEPGQLQPAMAAYDRRALGACDALQFLDEPHRARQEMREERDCEAEVTNSARVRDLTRQQLDDEKHDRGSQYWQDVNACLERKRSAPKC